MQVRDPTWLWNPGKTSPEVQNRGISGPTKRTNALQKYFLKYFSNKLISNCKRVFKYWPKEPFVCNSILRHRLNLLLQCEIFLAQKQQARLDYLWKFVTKISLSFNQHPKIPRIQKYSSIKTVLCFYFRSLPSSYSSYGILPWLKISHLLLFWLLVHHK